jgi:predicted outer membrane protein
LFVKSSIVIGASVLLFPLAAIAAEGISAQDKIFVQQAAVGGLAEVQEGQLAVSQGASATIKRFGQQMIDQHTSNNQALAALAKAKGISIPATTDAAHMANAAALKNTTGAAFDTASVTMRPMRSGLSTFLHITRSSAPSRVAKERRATGGSAPGSDTSA